MKKKIWILAALLAVILVFTAVGCTVKDDFQYKIYYTRGTYTEEGGEYAFYDSKGNLVFSGIIDGSVLALTKGDTTLFAVEENATEEEQFVSIKTVYEMAKELGYTGTLEELIERLQVCAEAAFKLDTEMTTIRDELLQAQKVMQTKTNLVDEIINNLNCMLMLVLPIK